MKPIAKDIGNTSQRMKARSYLNDRPYRSSKPTLEEQVFNSLILMTEYTPSTSMPVPLNKIIFGENNPLAKIPCKNLVFQWYYHLPYFLVITNWCI
jgi:hypothetical protein